MLTVRYGGTIAPDSLQVSLNGQSITTLFSPAPGTSQTVEIPLRTPENLLILSVAGEAEKRADDNNGRGSENRTVPDSPGHAAPVDVDKLKFHIGEKTE